MVKCDVEDFISNRIVIYMQKASRIKTFDWWMEGKRVLEIIGEGE